MYMCIYNLQGDKEFSICIDYNKLPIPIQCLIKTLIMDSFFFILNTFSNDHVYPLMCNYHRCLILNFH